MRAYPILAIATCIPSLFFAACETPRGSSDPCRAGAFNDAGNLAIISSPAPGDTVPSGTSINGCGRAFEGTLNYKLTGRDGSILASGFTQTGGADGAAPFRFILRYTISQTQLGHLEVFADDPSDGEGFPPSRCVIPIQLVTK